MEKQVVVTGIGTINPLGLDVKEFWVNLLAGKTAIDKIQSFDTENFPFEGTNGCEIADFNPGRLYPGPNINSYGKSAQLALIAARECLEDAGLEYAGMAGRLGIAMATTMGEPLEFQKLNDCWSEGFDRPVKPETVNKFFYYQISQALAREFRIYGPAIHIPNACSAGNLAIAHGYNLIKNNVLDAILVGGSDSFNRYTFAGFSRVGAVSKNMPRPFCDERDGMIPSEGCGVLLLESDEHARRRRAKIYGRVAGYGMSCDASHITQSNPDGVSQAYRRALESSGISPAAVSFISAHGTGTRINDQVETDALNAVFGRALQNIPVNSIKGAIGHTMGAASAIEAITAVLAIRDDVVPPTCNFTGLDPDFKNINLVVNQALPTRVNIVFETSSGFGGNNCVIIFERVAT